MVPGPWAGRGDACIHGASRRPGRDEPGRRAGFRRLAGPGPEAQVGDRQALKVSRPARAAGAPIDEALCRPTSVTLSDHSAGSHRPSGCLPTLGPELASTMEPAAEAAAAAWQPDLEAQSDRQTRPRHRPPDCCQLAAGNIVPDRRPRSTARDSHRWHATAIVAPGLSMRANAICWAVASDGASAILRKRNPVATRAPSQIAPRPNMSAQHDVERTNTFAGSLSRADARTDGLQRRHHLQALVPPPPLHTIWRHQL